MFTQHGFRHVASTYLIEMGYNKDWIEVQLAHKDSDTTRATYSCLKLKILLRCPRPYVLDVHGGCGRLVLFLF
ncbi:tyrosine-type recombinase/integrase [Wielerella bovis]|uniref:tyrosine-type recombinase/integrase n=1 Tax=Wielerella bovis TaxID=2917790 RepID=UPI0024B7D542|nr:tyrosine-type recombinase/integrase [Wielerella bovis]